MSDPHPTRSAPPADRTSEYDAALAAAFGTDPSPGGWSRPPLLRDEPSDHAPVVRPDSPDVPRASPGRYQVFGEIARGGMGAVLKARDPDLGRELAIKVLQGELAGKAAAEQRFVEEAQVGGQLQHPGLVPVYELGRFADGRPYFTMKLVKGRTLAALLADRPDPGHDRGRFLKVFEKIAETVAYAHSRGVIHRDLKPANVMVGSFGEVQVMDWGLAKVLPQGGVADEERASRGHHPAGVTEEPTVIRTARSGSGAGSETQAGSVFGTPAFMPPEQAGGEVDKLDERADVFGLGAVLCVILTGQPPYVAGTAEAVRLLAVRGRLADAHARLDGCGADAELVGLCKRCLAAEPMDRPRHAGEVAEAVRDHLAGVEDRAHRAEVDRAAAEARAAEEANTRRVAEARAAEERKRRRAQLALAAVVGLLAVGGGAFGWVQERQAADRRAERAAADTERRLKAEAARDQVTRLLALAEELRKEYRYRQAAAALAEAKDAAGAAPDLVPAVERSRADLEFVVELDAIRGKRSTRITGQDGRIEYDVAAAPPAYRAAFAARGLDVAADPAAAGAGVAASAVRAELVGALDDWLVLEPDSAVRDGVRAVLRRADPASPVAPFRDPAVWEDRAMLARLAAEAAMADPPPGVAVAIGWLLIRRELDATPLLRQAVRLHPRDFEAAFLLGQALNAARRFGDADEAIGAHLAARALRPDHSVTLYNLGAAFWRKGHLGRAEEANREAIRLDPEFGAAHHGLGMALEGKGDVDGAIAAFKESIRLNPKYAFTHHSLGLALSRKGDLAGAEASFRAAIRLAPKSLLSHAELGVVLERQGDLAGAEASFRAAIRLAPTVTISRSRLGNLLIRKGDLAGAEASYREAIRLVLKNAWAHRDLGNVLARKGDVAGAVAAHKESIRLDPKDAAAHTSLARLLATGPDGVRNGKEAIRLAARACELAGWKDLNSLDTLAAAYAEAGEFDKAVEYQKKAAALAAGNEAREADVRSRLGLYERKQPYRHPGLARREVAPPPRPARK